MPTLAAISDFFSLGAWGGVCSSVPMLPMCQVLTRRGDKACPLRGVNLGQVTILDIADVCLCLVVLILTGFLAYRTHSKYAAVGRSEMGIFNLFFFFTIAFQIISVGGWINSEPQDLRDFLLWAAIIHCGLVAATSWILFLNGLVAFQFVADGSNLSIYGIGGSGLLIFVGAAYVAADTAIGWTSALNPGQALQSTILATVTLYMPALFLVLYAILAVILVLTQLSVRKPLMFLGCGGAAFLLGQIFTFGISDAICTGTKQLIDGKVFATLLTFVAYACIYMFWSDITEDEWEDFEDQF
ncbi:hypothetical protein AMAG_02518 [Allomyces macrogynus ATCC 38327]|uniref:Uncharacterized protein n=1 Tax=Allomyces macrogynus (strain ATCC 38327) TaxID=578462 RepID=A0A0L0S2G6_ALLM3|nr:hypothetical protein AMAG_02518 [Allomyces macrogynus ATCC 38327]|eukprot:KNE56738.1 hypothetical protein AMAG_02518 [Allomyces macrogynus ATCC 38327]